MINLTCRFINTCRLFKENCKDCEYYLPFDVVLNKPKGGPTMWEKLFGALGTLKTVYDATKGLITVLKRILKGEKK